MTSIPMPKLGQKPPTEYLLYPYGATLTTKGTVYLTKESAKRVMDNFYKNGTVLTFNEEHLNLVGGTPGSFKLDLRDDGIWMSPIQWTPKYAQKITDGDYIYVSPEIEINEKNEIEKISKVALTNQPATKFLKPLLLSARSPMDSKIKMMQSMLASMQDAMRYGQTMLSEGIMTENKELVTEQVEALAENCTKVMSQLEKMGVTATSEEIKEEEKELLMDDDESDAEEEAEYSDDDEASEEYSEKDKETMETDVKKPKKTESKKFSSDESLKKIMDIVGSTDPDEAVGIILAMKTKESKIEKKLLELSKTEKEILVEKAIQDKKIAPSQKALYLSQSKATIEAALKRIDSDEETIQPVEKVTKISLSSQKESVLDEKQRANLEKIIGIKK